ncbi:DUF2256 domain-containing protein [Bosea sp. Root381]|uniref:DUF2256 domain-containing protein n=1 Tax=Bosea sp. Root381 TaxID=1736524 RepID=UPI0009E8A1CE|nr:DUF2256 domain-containing protein [Bosea sp. Root381]
MPKMKRKADLPTRICTVCGRPFAWRKKWERAWETIATCSDRCRESRRRETCSSRTPKLGLKAP